MRLRHIFTQLDVPIRQINEVLPAIVVIEAEVDLHKRTPLGSLGFLDEMHARLRRGAIRLARITLNAGTDNVFPRRRAAAVTRNDVIEIQIFAVKGVATVLASVAVALKDVVPGELHFLLRQPVLSEQQNDAR